jgi:hypothetical protein
MSTAIFALTAVLWVSHAPAGMLSDTTVSVKNCPSTIRVAQHYRDSDPHGDDPHGDDPHAENHDLGLPAHSMARGKATDNVYGNAVDAKNNEHPLDNFPGQPGF